MESEESHVVCPECGARYRTSSMEAGKKYRCKHCKHILDLPTGEPTVRLGGAGTGEPSIAEVLGQGIDSPFDFADEAWDRDEQQRIRTDVAIPPAVIVPPPVPTPAPVPPGEAPAAALPPAARPKGKGSSLEGLVLGDYEILSEIGRGGMGVVYKARQKGLDRIVAIKTLIPGAGASPDTLKRFEREAKAVARLNHPNIVPIYEYGEFRRTKYIVMEYVDGKSLERLGKGRNLPLKIAVELVRDIAFALHFAHTQGIVHRDLKPANVMLDARNVPRVMDFGLAKEMGSQSMISVTGDIMGTPSYMSPEQADGRVHEVGVRSDVYSLGAILYELLTGRPPFEGGSIAQTISMVLNDEPVSPRVLNPKIDADLDTIVLKTLSKKAAGRYATAKAFADDLDRHLRGDTIYARPPTIVERVSRRVKKNRGRVAAIAAGLLGLVLGIALVAHFVRDDLAFFSQKLASPSAEVRTSALRALVEETRQGRFEGAEENRAVALLVRGASDPDEGIRLMTVKAIPDIPGVRGAAPATRVALEGALADCTKRNHTRPLRLAALDAISDLGATGAEGALHTILVDPAEDEEVTLKAIRTTGRIGYFMRSFVPLMTVLNRGGIFRDEAQSAIRRLTEDPKGSGREPKPNEESFSVADTPILIKRFQRDVARTRSRQLDALEGLAEESTGGGERRKPARPMEVAQEKLRTGSTQERLQAVFLILTLKDPGGIGILFGLLGDSDALVAKSAANAIVSFGGPNVEDRLIEKARKADGREMENTAYALGELKSRDAVDPLLLALDRCKMIDSKRAVLVALGKIEDKRAVPRLIQSLGDPTPGIADGAAWALGRITGGDYGTDAAKWTTWWEVNG